MNDKADIKEIQGAARIGNGAKLHKAYKDNYYGLIILCGCPGTRQGSTSHRARFFPGAESNCKN